jgi:hypothetical protein
VKIWKKCQLRKVFKIGFPTSTNFPGFFSQLLAISFELFSFRIVFNSGIICHGVPPVSLSFSAPGPLISTPSPPAHESRQHCHPRAPSHKAVADRAPLLLPTASIQPPVSAARQPVRSHRRLSASDHACPSAPRPRRCLAVLRCLHPGERATPLFSLRFGRRAHLPPVAMCSGCRPPHRSLFLCRSPPAAPLPPSTFLVAAALLEAGEPRLTPT